ncbi:MAG: penicillin-binding protein 1C [Candidatus Hydrogenedentes bacterium]|nr:penicillin-binding protein 1C [Candidatus Hydrogenedentota bacterium]
MAPFRRAAVFALSACICITAALALFPALADIPLRVLASCLPPLDPAPYLATPRSGEVTDRDGRLLCAFLDKDEQWRFPRPLADISPRLAEATIAAEDKRFWSHPGVDPWAVARAVVQNLTGRRIASGASTLTMQVVKNTERTPRNWRGKTGQALAALRLERAVDKQAVLSAYLNGAPYGGNLVGAEAAARRWFGKPASELTLPEAALLAGLPKSPTGLNPLNRPERALARRNHVLRLMAECGAVTPEDAETAMAAPLGAAWHELPRLAPHLAMRLRGEVRNGAAVRTTLDARIQSETEQAVARHLLRFDGAVTNAAVIIADVGEGSMLARVGSAAFFDEKIAGQVDLCRRPRSPGSTLKPFTYALAMERNLLYATEQFLDDDLDFGAYHPSNFDGGFNGLVSAEEALRLSLNIPAVMALERVGAEQLRDFLRQAGMTSLTRSAAEYGLGLTLGGAGVSLESLADAYMMLARMGEFSPIQWRAGTDGHGPTQTGKSEPPTRLLARGTALTVWNMLDQPMPDDLHRNLVSTGGVPPKICWKTGTSAGFHDAWAVLFNRHYLVAVWLGNNSGAPSRHLVGARAALPLAARLFRGLPHHGGPSWPARGNDLVEVTVCAMTGLPASDVCPATQTALFPRTQYLHRRCAVHQPAESGGRPVECWPASPRRWDLARIPRHLPETTLENGGESARKLLAVTSPADKSEFLLTGAPNSDRIPLTASIQDREEVQWYVDGRYLGSSGPQKPLYWELAAGTRRITCMARNGDTANATIVVSGI